MAPLAAELNCCFSVFMPLTVRSRLQGSQPVGNLLNACGVQRRSVRYRGCWTPPPAACQTPRRPSPKAPSMGADLDRTSACARTMLGIFEPECRVPGLRQSAAALLRQIALGRAYLDGSQPKPSPAASAASAGLARSTLRCKSQPTLWGHASLVPGRGWRGTPPPRPPTGPRSRRKSTGCRTAPASTRQLGIDAACDRHHVPQPGGMVRPHRAESGAGGGAASLRARRRRVRSWGPAAREAGGSKGGAAPLARPQCSTLRGLAHVC